MEIFLVIVALLLFIGSLVVFFLAFQKGRKPKAPAARQDPLKFGEMPTFGPRQLGPGAIVSYGGVDYIVRGSVTLRQGPFVWWEHLIEGGNGTPLWFSVEEDEGRLELVLWYPRKDLLLQPAAEHVVDGLRFRETERGRASYTTEGTTGLPPAGDVDFIDYADPGETTLLGFERWAPTMPWEVSLGRTVSPAELTVYPAPPAGS